MTLVLTVGQAFAAAPTVGFVVAKDTIRIDSSTVRGNATVLNGNVLESAGGTSELRLNNGGSVHMAPNARVRMFQNVAELQSGKIQMSGAQANVNQIRVEAAAGSSAVVDRIGNRVVVGSLSGAVRVTDQEGVLLARLEPGKAIAIDEEQNSGAGTNPPPQNRPTPRPKPQPRVNHMGPVAKFFTVVGIGAGVGVPVAVVATRSDKPVPVSQ